MQNFGTFLKDELGGWVTDGSLPGRYTELNGSISRDGGGGFSRVFGFYSSFFVTRGRIPRGLQTTSGCSLNFTKSLSVSISLGSVLLWAHVCVSVPTLSVASIKPARADWDRGEDWQTTPAHRHTIITLHKHTMHIHSSCVCTCSYKFSSPTNTDAHIRWVYACVCVRLGIVGLPSPGCQVPTGHRLLEAVIWGRAVQGGGG